MAINRPSAQELAAGVREFLEEVLQPLLDDAALRYQTRVAANVLKILERELAQGDARSGEEQALLVEYLGRNGDEAELNAELIRRLDSGELAADDSNLLALLERISLGKLAIDNPRYSSYQALTGSDS